MATFGDNPMLIQQFKPSLSSSLPGSAPSTLVLIHDSSGLIFNYLRLKSLGRRVYGLWDPRFFDETRAEGEEKGDVGEVARLYCDMLEREGVPKGKLILGGWSLGGVIALQMAHHLLSQPGPGSDYTIVGILMIDTVCPTFVNPEVRTVTYEPQFEAHTSASSREYIRNSMARAKTLLNDFKFPRFEPTRPPRSLPPAAAPAAPAVAAAAAQPPSSAVAAAAVVTKDSDPGQPKPKPESQSNLQAQAQICPRTILLKTSNYVPVPVPVSNSTHAAHAAAGSQSSSNKDTKKSVMSIDVARHMPLLGWEGCGQSFIQTTLPIQGDHYHVFAAENISSTADQMIRALDILDG